MRVIQSLFWLCLLAGSGNFARAQTGAANPFTGRWHSDDRVQGISFSLKLTQRGTQLTGHHSAIAAEGRRIDDATPANPGETSEPSIVGYITNHVAVVSFRSGYGTGSHGTAELRLEKGQLRWRITAATGEHYFPQEAVLRPTPIQRKPGDKSPAPKQSPRK